MIRRKGLGLFLIIVIIAGTSFVSKTGSGDHVDYTSWVDPFIGTGGHGHTFPGAMVPFGLVQLSPDTRMENWDGSSGYYYADKTIMGFSHISQLSKKNLTFQNRNGDIFFDIDQYFQKKLHI